MREKFTLQTRQRICDRMASKLSESMTLDELKEFYLSSTSFNLKQESFDGLVELAKRHECFNIFEEELS